MEGHDPQFFQRRWIFGNFNISSENVQTFAAGKDKGFEFYQKVFNLPLPKGATTPLIVG